MNFEPILQASLFAVLLLPLVCTTVLGLAAFAKTLLSEHTISRITQSAFLLYLVSAVAAVSSWLALGAEPYRLEHFGLHFELEIENAVFMMTSALIANVIVSFSRRYLHRDPGYRRFFMVISLFLFGLTVVMLASEFALIFAGWEILGLSSFLLIGFYWHRPQAMVNASRAYYIYRFCDLGFLGAALLSHWHWQGDPLTYQWLLSLAIFLPVIGKSAQFPLCYWLPRAMEGPTPSSAIFYGSLSIHAGVLLLIKTFPIWYATPGFVWLVGGIGLLSALFATLCGQTQANIKGQIGYASIAQVGIILVELACGLPYLALFHLVGNAFLRCFQLLVSPSIVAQQLQIHGALDGQIIKNPWAFGNWLPQRARSTLYMLALNEGYLEPIIKTLVVSPVAKVAGFANQIHNRVASLFLSRAKPNDFSLVQSAPGISFLSIALVPAATLAIGTLTHFLQSLTFVPYVFLGAMLFFSLSAHGEFKKGMRVLNAVVLSNVFGFFALLFHHAQSREAALYYLVGLGISWLLAHDAFSFVFKRRVPNSLHHFSGLFSQFPLGAALCLIGILGILGFPLASTFLGVEMLFEHAATSGWVFLVAFALTFVLNGITLIRLHSRIFMGERDAEIPEARFDYQPWQAALWIGVFVVGNWLTWI